MSRLLVVGPCPAWALPPEQSASARNVRAWQLLAPLLADGHEILLCVTDAAPPAAAAVDRLTWARLAPADLGWRRRLAGLCAGFAPAAAVAIMWQNSLLATQLPSSLPLWIDLFGYALGEAQVAAARAGDDRPPWTALRYNRRILRRGDVFSTCSQRQLYALVGELGTAGRLTRRTTGYAFVHPIPPAIAEPPGDLLATVSVARPPAPVRLLWIGGYNAWTDVDTLFDAVTLALTACPELVFVSTGGAIPAVDPLSYPRLLARIADSPLRARFQMLGWVSAAELEAQLTAADIGLMVDAPHYETLLGTRTRLVELLARGIPVIATRGSELSEQIAAAGAGLAVPAGDPAALAAAILALAQDPGRRAAAAAAARRLTAAALNAENTTQPLRRWASAPQLAPDRASPGPGALAVATGSLRSWGRVALWDILGRP